jgi:hypothetical protein
MSRENLVTSAGKSENYLEKEFQDWLKSLGLIQESPKEISELQFSGFFKATFTQMTILDLLGNSVGYLVPTRRIARVLYGYNLGRDELRAASEATSSLRRKLVNPNLILPVSGIGFGLGVERFDLHPQDLVLMHLFWHSQGEWLPTGKISEATNMSRDAIECRVMAWRRRENYGGTFTIQSQLSSGKGYCFLSEKESNIAA